jgi:hypothetical protein
MIVTNKKSFCFIRVENPPSRTMVAQAIERQGPETADRLVDESPPQYDAIQPCFWQPAFFRHNHGCHASSS